MLVKNSRIAAFVDENGGLVDGRVELFVFKLSKRTLPIIKLISSLRGGLFRPLKRA